MNTPKTPRPLSDSFTELHRLYENFCYTPSLEDMEKHVKIWRQYLPSEEDEPVIRSSSAPSLQVNLPLPVLDVACMHPALMDVYIQAGKVSQRYSPYLCLLTRWSRWQSRGLSYLMGRRQIVDTLLQKDVGFQSGAEFAVDMCCRLRSLGYPDTIVSQGQESVLSHALTVEWMAYIENKAVPYGSLLKGLMDEKFNLLPEEREDWQNHIYLMEERVPPLAQIVKAFLSRTAMLEGFNANKGNTPQVLRKI